MNNKDILNIATWLANEKPTAAGKTIAAIVLGAKTGDFRAPSDYIDFRDCYRLIEECPSIKSRFQEIVDIAPCMFETLYNWEELSELYRLSVYSKSKNQPDFSGRLSARLYQMRVSSRF